MGRPRWHRPSRRRKCAKCPRHVATDELIFIPALGWICAYCVEDSRAELEGR